jgi:uncharacterized C2H2 Zn-finger protein
LINGGRFPPCSCPLYKEVNMFKCPFCGIEFLREQDYNLHVVKCPNQYGKPEKKKEKHEPKVEEKKEK